MTERSLGEFEQLVLLAVLRLGDGTYGVEIVREIEERSRREVSRAAVYVALQRLERKGLVRSWLEKPESGKARRLVAIEAEAIELLRASQASLLRMWEGIDALRLER